MSRPLLLDLFCGGGGSAMGYHRAGFDVIGVDHEPQPHYPFTFVQGDALDAPVRFERFDAVHASPPCHDHAALRIRNRRAPDDDGTGWLLDETLARFADLDVPWIVENVETAVMPPSVYRVRLCGSSFGLDVRRHRWFASNVCMLVPPCDHGWQTPRFRSLDSRRGFRPTSVVPVHGHLNYPGELELRRQAMGIDWLPNERLSQAIPPAYTELLGSQLMAAL